MMQPQEHARLLGLFFLIYAGLHLLLFVFFGLIYVGIFGTAMFHVSQEVQTRPGEPSPEAIFGIVIVVIVAMLAFACLFLIPKIVAGVGLRRGKSWAKVWAIIACCMCILNVPFGTALAVYGFWFIFGDMGRAYFDGYQLPYHNNRHAPPPPPHNWQ